MFYRAAALMPARPEEILRQVNPWWILFTCFLGLLGNLAPASGIVLVVRPDFLALGTGCDETRRSGRTAGVFADWPRQHRA
jgi:hypothetical protein